MRVDVAAAAKDGATLRRIKRNRCAALAFGAVHCNFNSLLDTGSMSGFDQSDAFVFLAFAWAAAFWRMRQAFVAEENLFADRPNESFATIYATDLSVIEIGFVTAQFLIKPLCNFKLKIRQDRFLLFARLEEINLSRS